MVYQGRTFHSIVHGAAITSIPDLASTHPIEVWKILRQKHEPVSLRQFLRRPQLWYTGILPRAMAYVPMRVCFWTGYSASTQYAHSLPWVHKVVLATCTTVSVQAPLELYMDTRYTWAVHAKQHNLPPTPPRMYMGVVPQLLRNVTYCSIAFGALLAYQEVGHDTVPLWFGLGVGMVASGISHPLDTWKTRMQTSPTATWANTMPNVLARCTYRGLSARALSNGVGTGVGFCVLQLIQKCLSEEGQ